MKDLQNWIQDPNRSYRLGVDLYRHYKGEDQFLNYFMQGIQNPTKAHANLLYKRLTDVSRKIRQNSSKPSQPQQPKPVVKTKKDIDVREIAPSGKLDVLRGNKTYINKLLTLQWKDLEKRDRAVFFNNEKYFAAKKQTFIGISDREREIKSMHAAMKKEDDKEKRGELINRMKELENQNVQAWQEVDDFTEPQDDSTGDPVKDAEKKGEERANRIKNLKSYIKRAEREISKGKYKREQTVKRKQAKIKQWKAELKELQNAT